MGTVVPITALAPATPAVSALRAADGSLLDIVCIATSNWGVVKSNPDYTILGLAARGHRVLVVEPFESLSSAIRMARIQKRRVGNEWGVRKVDANIWAYRPPPLALPGQSRTPVAGRASGRLLAMLVRRVARQLGFRHMCLWSFMYNSGAMLAALPAEIKIYENGDDDSALARNEAQRRTVRQLDAEACRAADLVFAVTEELCAPRRVSNAKTFEVNCGADVAFFGRALHADARVPAAIARLPKPVIGYVGGLDPWKIDIPLLTAMARLRPSWSIALVGYVWFGFDRGVFADMPNIHVLGPQAYDDLPLFMRGMDVGLMPFPLNDITRNGDALKCYEYLSAGLPVVGRDVPVARRLRDFVAVADSAEEIVAACEAQLADTAMTPRRRNEAMRAHDWSRRVEQKIAIIREAVR